jgi:Pyridoxamine 5'-phosphate oxidase
LYYLGRARRVPEEDPARLPTRKRRPVEGDPQDLERLQELLTASIERAGGFLRGAFQIPERSLSATQLAGVLDAYPTVALATTTSKGEPRVAPTNAIFYRGAFQVPTVAASARARHVEKRPAVSLAYYQGSNLAVIVHGRAVALGHDHPDFVELDDLQREYGESPTEWGEGVFLRVEADVLYTYASEPRRYLG